VCDTAAMLSATRNGHSLSGLGTAIGCRPDPRYIDGYKYGGDLCPQYGNLYLGRTVVSASGAGWRNLRKSVGATVTAKIQRYLGWDEASGTLGHLPSGPFDVEMLKFPGRLIGDLPVGGYDNRNSFFVQFYAGATKITKDNYKSLFPKVDRVKIAIHRDPPSKGFWDQIEDIGSGIISALHIDDLVDMICGPAMDPRVQAAQAALIATAVATGVISPTGVVAGGAAAAAALCALNASSGAPPPPPLPVKVPTGPTAPTTTISHTIAKPATIAYAGGIAALDPKTGLYRIAMPTGLHDFGAPAPFTQVAVAASPGAASVVTPPDFDKQTGQVAWYKRPMTYAIAGGVLAVGGGVMILRRRR